MRFGPFWQRLSNGVEIAVASSVPEKLLGARDGFLEFFHHGLDRKVPVAVVPHPEAEDSKALPTTAEETIATARREVSSLADRLGDQYHFYLAGGGGLQHLAVGSELRVFVNCWVVLRSEIGETWGASGAIEIPSRLLSEGGAELPSANPGTRRGGGMISSLTGGLESRRQAFARGTLHALSSLFFGLVEARRRRLD